MSNLIFMLFIEVPGLYVCLHLSAKNGDLGDRQPALFCFFEDTDAQSGRLLTLHTLQIVIVLYLLSPCLCNRMPLFEKAKLRPQVENR